MHYQGCQHPKGLYVLGLAEAMDRLNYYGIQAILVLYMTQKLLLSHQQAYSCFGVYATLAFATPVLGGYIADNYCSFKNAIIFGALLITLGNLTLFWVHTESIYTGLALIILGIGFLKGNATSQLRLCYQERATLRESGFTLFYVGMNLGSIVGPILFGLAAIMLGWRYGFMLSGIGMLIAALLYLSQHQYFGRHNNLPRYRKHLNWVKIAALPATTLLVLLILALFHHPDFFSTAVFLGVLGILGVLTAIIKKANVIERRRIVVFAILTLFTIAISACEMQTGSSLMFYLNQDVHSQVDGHLIPTAFFGSLEPISVVIVGIVFNYVLQSLKKRDISISAPFMVSLGLLSGGVAFICFALSGYVSFVDHFNLRLCLVIIGNFFIGAGDLCSTAPVLAIIGILAPPNREGLFMGIYFTACALSGYCAVLMINTVKAGLALMGQNVSGLLMYRNVFWGIALITLIMTICAFLLAPKLNRMMM